MRAERSDQISPAFELSLYILVELLIKKNNYGKVYTKVFEGYPRSKDSEGCEAEGVNVHDK